MYKSNTSSRRTVRIFSKLLGTIAVDRSCQGKGGHQCMELSLINSKERKNTLLHWYCSCTAQVRCSFTSLYRKNMFTYSPLLKASPRLSDQSLKPFLLYALGQSVGERKKTPATGGAENVVS